MTGNGAALISVASAARDRLSTEMNFEEAARQHKRLERIQSVLALRGDLVCDIDRLYGVAIAPSLAPDSVLLWFVCQGAWQAPVVFPLTSLVSLDQRLRELVASIQPVMPPLARKAGAPGAARALALFHLERRRMDRVPGDGASAVSEIGAGDFARAPEGGVSLDAAFCKNSLATSRAGRCSASTA